MAELLGALDQGTTSTRFIIFSPDGEVVGSHQLEHAQVMARAGWVEHDPVEIWERTKAVIATAMQRSGTKAADLAAVGIANQRETTVVWDRRSGLPLYNAIVWQDTRTAPALPGLSNSRAGELILERTGLVPATYFSGLKLAWILDNVDGARQAAERGDALFGTVDSWLVWKLTGGLHVTDVTNASRTMLMDLERLSWDGEILEHLRVPPAMLPAIRPSTDTSGLLATQATGPLEGKVPIAAVLGDQQAAMVGQVRFEPGETKCTYGTGNFVLMNTGTKILRSPDGLLSTVCYQFDGEQPRYALEGSVAVSGAAVQWLRDQLKIVQSAGEAEHLARTVPSTEGLYFVPAFSGLFAPYWRPDARGVIVGLSRSHTSAHLARAALEAIAYQTRDVIDAMASGGRAPVSELRADGGVTANELCMQIQADVLGAPVVRPVVLETTALGAAYAAGLAVGLFSGPEELRGRWREGKRWYPKWDETQRAARYAEWKKAIERTLGWAVTESPLAAGTEHKSVPT
ncbi:MAG: glycerol kinase GlpK [Acidimicrobiales bacterium]